MRGLRDWRRGSFGAFVVSLAASAFLSLLAIEAPEFREPARIVVLLAWVAGGFAGGLYLAELTRRRPDAD